MSAADNTARRRGWCPGVRRPMETGDGLLVRIHPMGGRITADTARLIAQAADAHGNGLLDITARGNLQIRGVREDTYPALLTQLEGHGLAEPEGEGPNRLTLISPLAGIDPRDHVDALALAQTVESQAGAMADLPAKFFIAIDGGGLMSLDKIGADLHLLATGNDTIAFGFASTRDPHWVGATSLARATEAALMILNGFAGLRREGRTEARRLRDLPPALAQELASLAGLEPSAPPRKRQPIAHAGAIELGETSAVLLALPFGRCNTTQLAQASEWSERFGTREIRLSFTRGLLLPGVGKTGIPTLLDEAGRFGFITDPDDVRLSVFACPGSPSCASAATPAPDHALQLAGAGTELLANETTLHVSGCSKGCAHPGKADLTLVGRDGGAYDVIVDGSPQDAISIYLSIEEIMTRLSIAKTPDDLRRVFQGSAR